jgi:hypothetical protein
MEPPCVCSKGVPSRQCFTCRRGQAIRQGVTWRAAVVQVGRWRAGASSGEPGRGRARAGVAVAPRQRAAVRVSALQAVAVVAAAAAAAAPAIAGLA